jgi:hypothetical protein
MSRWRDISRKVVRETLAAAAGKPEPEIKAALREAYPFGERAMHPYKIWLDEIKRQRGTKLSTGPCLCSHSKGAHRARAGACAASDCGCRSYRTEDERQQRLGMVPNLDCAS